MTTKQLVPHQEIQRQMRIALQRIQDHRRLARELDEADLSLCSGEEIEAMYERVLEYERAIHTHVVNVETMKEVNNVSEDEQRRTEGTEGEQAATEQGDGNLESPQPAVEGSPEPVTPGAAEPQAEPSLGDVAEQQEQ